jgi:PAS domain S-box-containing protein
MKEKEALSDLPDALPPCGSKPSYRILVVDDEKAVRDLHLEVLTGAGYEVLAVANGALAWDAIQTQHFDLMITDNSMPKVSGVEVINKLIAANTKLPVIMVTGALPEHEFKRYSWLSNIAVLEKPVNNSAILSMVKKFLNEGKGILDEKVDPSELATKIESSQLEVVSKDERRIEKAENRIDRAEEISDKTEARFDEAASRSQRIEARSGVAEILNIAALRSSEIRYRRLFEAAKDGILILDVETGRITDVNPYLIELLGFSKSEMVDKTVGELSPFKDIEPNQVMLDRLKRDGYVRYENLPLENNDNQHVAVEFVCNVYQEDTVQVIQCNIRDITERKRAEDQKEQFSLELEKRVLERTAELEAFSGAVSHDLRAPLRHLASYLGELQEQTDQTFSKKNLELLTSSSRATKRMGNLIDDLLAFSRVSTASIKKTAVSVEELIRETLDDYSPEIKYRQIEWTIQPLGVAMADPALLRLVFGNMVSNALKFTGGRTNAKIEIGCARDSTSEIVFFVRDNGAGFDPEYTEKLFGLFQRLHSQEEFEGTGLGLANMQRIILRHGGRVWAEGAVGVGATFYFSLPK